MKLIWALALPGKVAPVTTAEFNVPEIGGVTWTTSDSSLISIEDGKAVVNRVKGEEQALMQARMTLISLTRTVICNTMSILKITAPEKM